MDNGKYLWFLALLLGFSCSCDPKPTDSEEQTPGSQGGGADKKEQPSKCQGQVPELLWTKTFQGGQFPGNNAAYGLAVGRDALYLAGQAMHAPEQGKAIMLRASKQDGSVQWVQWRRPTQSSGGSKAAAAAWVDNVGVVFVGTESIVDSGSDEGLGTGIWVQRMGLDGQLVWEDRYEQERGTKNAEGMAVAVAKDNGIAVLGSLEPLSKPVQSWWLRRYGPAGNVEWTAIDSVDNVSSSAANMMIEPRSGTIYLTGASVSPQADHKLNLMLAAYTADGARKSHRVDTDPKALDSGNDIAQLSGGDLIIVGIKRDSDGMRKAFLRRQKTSGEVVWTKIVDASSRPSSSRAVVVDDNDNIYVVGSSEIKSSGSLKSWLAKLDATGQESWRREFKASQDGDKLGSLSFADLAIDQDCRLFVFGTQDERSSRNFLLSAFQL